MAEPVLQFRPVIAGLLAIRVDQCTHSGSALHLHDSAFMMPAPAARIRSAVRLASLTLALTLGTIVSMACSSADASKGTASKSVAAVSGDTLPDSLLLKAADLGRYEGSETAPIWIVMISDFQCPYCKQWHDSTLPTIKKEYVETGKARFAYLNLPLQSHRHALMMAKAGLCAAAQKQFSAYSEAMFHKQQTVANLSDVGPLLTTIADSLKLDAAAFAHCQRSNAVSTLVQSDIRQVTDARITATPSFFVGNFILEGAVPLKGFKQAVDSALVLAAKKAR
jgi:protein-disulfide isomerase